MKRSLVAAALFGIFFIQGFYLIQNTSPTTDEVPFHMVNGYVYLKTHDYRMSPANPPLLREWMALPWLFMDPKLDLNKTFWRDADSVPFGIEFFYKDNRAIADRLLYSSRFMILLLGAALGLVIFLWSRELYGPWAGLLSLSFYVFCPGLVAHSSIAHTDIGVTLFCAMSSYLLWRFLENGRASGLAGMAAAFALACAAKYNALFFGPIFLLILFLKKGPGTALKALGLMAVLGFAIVWSTYFFEYKPILSGGVPRVAEKLGYIQNFLFLKDAALKTPVPLASYILGLAGIVRSHQSSYLHYAFGEWTTKPHWYFYFFSFLTKMTLPFLCLLALRLVFLAKASSARRNENLIVVLPTLALFWITAKDSTGVGIRYLFPVIPLLMVWIGGLVKLCEPNVILRSPKDDEGSQGLRFFVAPLLRMTIILLIVFNIYSAIRVFPDYLSYFNEAVGGVRGGHKYVRGSDVDWGQGLVELKKYADKNGIEKVALEYFGSADPSFYGIPYEIMSAEEKKVPKAKVYAVGLFYLEHVEWAHELDPTAVVGGSIFIYDLRKWVRG